MLRQDQQIAEVNFAVAIEVSLLPTGGGNVVMLRQRKQVGEADLSVEVGISRQRRVIASAAGRELHARRQRPDVNVCRVPEVTHRFGGLPVLGQGGDAKGLDRKSVV